MTLKLYNTLTRQIENFEPINPEEVKIYSCGPTVYGCAHIGNFRAFVFNDLLRRYLKYKGYKANHVVNITDIDDKTIKGAKSEGVSLSEFTEKYTNIFFTDLDILNVEKVEHYPRATDFIQQMVSFISGLEKKGLAYESDGSIYFKISAFSDYGKLSNIDAGEIKTGLRYDTDEYEKKDIRDFVLWKQSRSGEPHWEASFGKGRPGWHLECSVMAKEILGDTLDIHTGGVDLIFPHHENEIAQSESLNEKKFVNYWLHVEHLLVNNRKMSKSLGNLFTINDLIEKGYDGREIRYLLLSAHYRKKFNFTMDGLGGARQALKRLDSLTRRLNEIQDQKIPTPFSRNGKDIFVTNFIEAMDNDLNIPEALSHLFNWVHILNAELENNKTKEMTDFLNAKEVLATLREADSVLGFIFNANENSSQISEEKISDLIDKRRLAKISKDFKEADRIRDELLSLGIKIEDTPGGTRWYKDN